MSHTRKLVVGTRGSKLALWQTGWLVARLREKQSELEIETRIISTQGDRIQDRLLQSVGDEGFFVRELEEALLRKDIDLAIHSLKDLPHAQPAGLVVPCTPGRVDARDALISKNKLSLADLPDSACIGTGSVRRASQLLAFRPDFKVVGLRGNVDTRLRKLHDAGDYDAIVLAAAGLERLSQQAEITQKLDYQLMLPAPGQGALAPECRADDAQMIEYLAAINDLPAQAAVTCEKAFMAALGGGCQTPVGCFAQVKDGKLSVQGYVGSVDGTQIIRVELDQFWQSGLVQAAELGKSLAWYAKEQGAMELLQSAREAGYVTERK